MFLPRDKSLGSQMSSCLSSSIQNYSKENQMKNRCPYPLLRIGAIALSALALTCLAATQAGAGGKNKKKFEFDLVRSPGLNASPNCAPDAEGDATIVQFGPVEVLRVKVEGLPPKT